MLNLMRYCRYYKNLQRTDLKMIKNELIFDLIIIAFLAGFIFYIWKKLK